MAKSENGPANGSSVTMIVRVEDVISNKRAARLVVRVLEAANVSAKLEALDIIVPSGLGRLYKKASDLGKNDEIVVSGQYSTVPLSENASGSITATRIGVLARRTLKRDSLEKAISSF